MLRQVQLTGDQPGRLYLHSMPGRYELFVEFCTEAGRLGINRVVCLAPTDEIERKSPDYASAIRNSKLAWTYDPFPITDFGAPEDRPGFWHLAQRIAKALRAGDHVLIHCGAGIGRTGTLATCVLLALDVPPREARKIVSVAGSAPERPEQEAVIEWASLQAPAFTRRAV